MIRGSLRSRSFPGSRSCRGQTATFARHRRGTGKLPGGVRAVSSGADLIDLGVTYCQLRDANFTNAEFNGKAEFDKAALVPDFLDGWSAIGPGHRLSGRRPYP